jgi:4-hydroxy-tetrahydrodipicolinate reductase
MERAMLDLCIVGGLGRMGKAIADRAGSESDMRIISVWETRDAIGAVTDYTSATGYGANEVLLTTDGRVAAGASHVVVDFSSSMVFEELVKVCLELSRPLVTGTTAIPDKEARLEALAAAVAVVSAPNMAVGVNVLFGLCRSVAGAIGEYSDMEIVETHHRTKKDVPSGTALEIGRLLSDETGKPVRVGRARDSGLRSDEIMIHSLRVGDVAGKHTVVFAPPGETLEITHAAQSRACFAGGALLAAGYAAKALPGLYSMLDVLGLGKQEG